MGTSFSTAARRALDEYFAPAWSQAETFQIPCEPPLIGG
jgi:hypothetical protein